MSIQYHTAFSDIVLEPLAHYNIWRQLAERGFIILGVELATRTQCAPRDRDERIRLPESNAEWKRVSMKVT